MDLSNSEDKVSIGPCSVNSFAYADDITVMCTTVPGLQRLINICAQYACKWRFRFGVKKTKCMVMDQGLLSEKPMWHMNDSVIEYVEILGVHFDSKGEAHANVRSEKCRRAFHSLRDVGMAYPGSATEVKAYLWNTMCQPVLSYGLETINLKNNTIKRLEILQGNLLKQALGFSKTARSTNLMKILGVLSIEERIKRNTAL